MYSSFCTFYTTSSSAAVRV